MHGPDPGAIHSSEQARHPRPTVSDSPGSRCHLDKRKGRICGPFPHGACRARTGVPQVMFTSPVRAHASENAAVMREAAAIGPRISPSRTRSDRSTAHPIAQVKHPVGLDHHRRSSIRCCVDRTEVALAEFEHNGYDVHSRTLSIRPAAAPGRRRRQRRPRPCGHLALLRLGHGCPRRRRRERRSRVLQPSGSGRGHDDHGLIPPGGFPFPSQPSVVET